MISFIIPCYNIPVDMLRECIDSILALSLKEDEREIIVIDDGSEHAPIADLHDIIDQIVYVRQKNGGLSNARNTGLRLCKGDYIQLIDADDFLIRTPYEHCLDIMRYEQPDLVLFHSSRKKTGNIPLHFNAPMDGACYMRHNNIRAAAWGYLFRRQILGNLRFREGIYHEDEEFTPQLLLRAERVFATDAEAYYYRIREDSIMQRTDSRSVMKRLADQEDVIRRLHLMATKATAINSEALQRRVAQLTMDYLYNIIMQTRSYRQLEKRVSRLYEKGLFPLPDKSYTRKYQWFRRLANYRTGRRLLCQLIPHLPI